jgi:hypothetical protein
VTVTGATSAHVRITVDGTSKLDSDVGMPAGLVSLRFKCGVDDTDPDVSAEVFVDDLTLSTCSP